MAALQASDKCSHTHVCCAFSIGLRLALEPDLRFLNHFYCFRKLWAQRVVLLLRPAFQDQFKLLFFYMPAPLIHVMGLAESKMLLFIEPPRGIQAFKGPQKYFRVFLLLAEFNRAGNQFFAQSGILEFGINDKPAQAGAIGGGIMSVDCN